MCALQGIQQQSKKASIDSDGQKFSGPFRCRTCFFTTYINWLTHAVTLSGSRVGVNRYNFLLESLADLNER